MLYIIIYFVCIYIYIWLHMIANDYIHMIIYPYISLHVIICHYFSLNIIIYRYIPLYIYMVVMVDVSWCVHHKSNHSPPKSVTNTRFPRSSVKLILSSSFLSLFKEINCADTLAKVAGTMIGLELPPESFNHPSISGRILMVPPIS